MVHNDGDEEDDVIALDSDDDDDDDDEQQQQQHARVYKKQKQQQPRSLTSINRPPPSSKQHAKDPKTAKTAPAKGVNDALKAFHDSFGLAGKSPSASSVSSSRRAGTTSQAGKPTPRDPPRSKPSHPSRKATASSARFQSSFDDGPSEVGKGASHPQTDSAGELSLKARGKRRQEKEDEEEEEEEDVEEKEELDLNKRDGSAKGNPIRDAGPHANRADGAVDPSRSGSARNPPPPKKVHLSNLSEAFVTPSKTKRLSEVGPSSISPQYLRSKVSSASGSAVVTTRDTKKGTGAGKPLRVLDTGIGLSSHHSLVKREQIDRPADAEQEDGLPAQAQRQEVEEEEEKKKDIKPLWSALAAAGAGMERAKRTQEQDVLELLSPRKKRRGWVPNGLAERAAQLVKRHQTAHTLWIHELSRLLSSSSSSSSSSSLSSGSGPRKPAGRTLAQLMVDTNPLLRLRIVEAKSGVPASLFSTFERGGGGERERDPSSGQNRSGGGGFVSAGAVEKLLIARCRILRDEEVVAAESVAAGPGVSAHDTRDADERGREEEGLVVFSLAAQRKAASSSSAVPPPPRPALPPPSRAKVETEHGTGSQSALGGRPRNAAFAGFTAYRDESHRSLLFPATVADLHTKLVDGEEIWVWDPWSTVELKDFGQKYDGAIRQEEQPEPASLAKALLVSRFGLLV